MDNSASSPRQSVTENLREPERTEGEKGHFESLVSVGNPNGMTTKQGGYGSAGLVYTADRADKIQAYGGAVTGINVQGNLKDAELFVGERIVIQPDTDHRLGFYQEAEVAYQLAPQSTTGGGFGSQDEKRPVVGKIGAGAIVQVAKPLAVTVGGEFTASNMRLADPLAAGKRGALTGTVSVQGQINDKLSVAVTHEQSLIRQDRTQPNPNPGPFPPPNPQMGKMAGPSHTRLTVNYAPSENDAVSLQVGKIKGLAGLGGDDQAISTAQLTWTHNF